MATSVSSSTSTTSSLSAKTGMGGLVSGLDTDTLVEKMTTGSRAKIAKQQQSLQKFQWKQTAYRGVSKALKEFQSKYLDVLSTTNFRSESLYNTVKASTTSTKISVESTSAANAGSIAITNVTQLATNETISGVAGASKPLTGNVATTDIDGLLSDITANGSRSFLMNLNGNVRTVTLDSTFVSDAGAAGVNIQTAMKAKIDAAFGTKTAGASVVDVSWNGTQLGFSSSGSQVTISALNYDSATLTKLGFTDGQSDRINTTKTLADISPALVNSLDAGGVYNFSINGKKFEFSSTDSLSTVMSKVNTSDAGVTMSYSSITDKFTLTAKESGAGENIVINETTGNLMSAFGLTGAGSNKIDGQNALLDINGISVARTSNSIVVDGVKINLLEKTAAGESLTVSMKADSTSLKDTIKSFVTDYNNTISMINGLVKEDVDKSYLPLSDEQKKDMSETEIAAWEKKAKVGLLRGDSALKEITSKMQTLMTGKGTSGGISLYDLGITSAGYTENGKLKIDDEKLTAALETKGPEIKALFATETTGLANQLNSVVESAVKTSGIKGSRGSLIELAGYESTLSNTENNLTTSITKTNKTITDLKTALKKEETYYWSKFTALETAMQKLNSQSSMITSFGSGS
ncbi:MAG: flagellar filament capping protein FliD [Acetobacterium woodii]|nr:flagellar filament capping protein FliD [Acetobacterium woodii]